MDRSSRVLISILNWNGGTQVIDCLQALHASTHRDFDVLLIDNGSTDGSVAAIEQQFPQVRVLRNDTNEGFAAGHNLAMRRCLDEGYEALWILNSDARVQPQTLSLLVEALRAAGGMATVSPVVYYDGSEERIQFCGGRIDWDECVVHNFSAEKFLAGATDPGAHPFLWGTALLIGRSALARIGFFDSRFFAYFEDTDFSVRAQRAGIAQKLVAQATVRHASPLSMWERPPHFFYFMTRNEMLFWAKHLRAAARWRFVPRYIGESLARAARCRDLGNAAGREACLQGMMDGLKGRGGAFNPLRRPPRWLDRLLMWHPYFVARLLARLS